MKTTKLYCTDHRKVIFFIKTFQCQFSLWKTTWIFLIIFSFKSINLGEDFQGNFGFIWIFFHQIPLTWWKIYLPLNPVELANFAGNGAEFGGRFSTAESLDVSCTVKRNLKRYSFLSQQKWDYLVIELRVSIFRNFCEHFWYPPSF